MDWQPIETAPRDGTKVDLWVVHSDGQHRHPDCIYMDAQTEDGQDIGWTVQMGFAVYGLNGTPTHWMMVDAPEDAQ